MTCILLSLNGSVALAIEAGDEIVAGLSRELSEPGSSRQAIEVPPAASPDAEHPLQLDAEIAAPSLFATATPESAPAASTVQPGQPDALIQFARKLLLLALVLLLWRRIHQWWAVVKHGNGADAPDWSAVQTANWPRITVLLQVRDVTTPLAARIEALLAMPYPPDCLHIRPVGQFTAAQRSIAADYAVRLPKIVLPSTERSLDGLREADSDLIVLLRAEWALGPDTLRQLVAPFFDPATGAVLAPLAPVHVARPGARLLALWRNACVRILAPQQVQAGLPPLDHGVLCAMRRSAIEAAGGWQWPEPEDAADISYRLMHAGFVSQFAGGVQCTGVRRDSNSSPLLALLRHLPRLLVSRRLRAEQKRALALRAMEALCTVLEPLVMVLALLMYVAGEATLAGLAMLLMWLAGNQGRSLSLLAAGAMLSRQTSSLRLLPLVALRAAEAKHVT